MAWQLQSSVHGKIRRLLMVAGNAYTEELWKIILEMYYKKSDHTQLVIFCNTWENRLDIEKWLLRMDNYITTTSDANDNDPTKIIILPPNERRHTTQFEAWARDPFLVLSSKGFKDNEVSLLESGSEIDIDIVSWLSKHGFANKYQSEGWLKFAGGDVLSDGNYAIIGHGTLERTKQFFATREGTTSDGWDEIVKQKIAWLFGFSTEKLITISVEGLKKMGDIGVLFKLESWFSSPTIKNKGNSTNNNFAHIDLFLTPTGIVSNDQCNKPVLFLAKVVSYSSCDFNIEKLNYALDILECNLSSKFLVLRNELPWVEIPEKDWIFLFYNNCLVENYSAEKTVWLPCYLKSFENGNPIKEKINESQDCNVQLWKAIGFKVKFIEADFIPISKKRGSLHCLTNELIRTET